MERTLIAQSTDCPIGNLDSSFQCRARNIVPNINQPQPYPNFSVPSGGIIATLPDYMGTSFYGKLQEGFVQSVVLALIYLGVTLVIKYLNSLKK
jgi:hypothetical protein